MRPAPELEALSDEDFNNWVGLDPEKLVALMVTRDEMGYVFIAIRRLQDALASTLMSFNAWTGGDGKTANEAFLDARDANIQSMNAMTRFMRAAMTKAQNVG